MTYSKWIFLVEELFHLPTVKSLTAFQTIDFLTKYVPPNWPSNIQLKAKRKIVDFCVIYK